MSGWETISVDGHDPDAQTLFDGMVIEYDEGTLWFDEEMGPIGPDDVEIGDVAHQCRHRLLYCRRQL